VTTAAIVAVTAVAALAGAAREIVVGLPLFGAGTLLTMISSTYAVPLQAQLRLGVSSGLEFARQVVNSAGTIALVVAGAGLFAFFGLWVVVCAAVTVATAWIVRRTVSVRPAFHWPTWRRFLREALAYGVAAAAGLVYFRMAASLMTFLSSELETGYYAMAFRVLETGAMVPWLLVNSVFPILARAATNDRERLRYAAQRVVEVGLIVGAGMTLLLMVGARPVVDLVGGAEFVPAVPVLRIQALVLVATVFVSAWSLLLLSLDEQRALLVINGIAVVVSLAAAFVLIPVFDAVGGSVDVLVAEVIVAALSVVVLWRRHPDVAPSLRPLWKVLAAVGLAAAAAIPLGDVAGTGVALVVYVAVLLGLRAVPTELWHALRGSPG
jgi:O-antigen/teichoic acid export membrane protein